MLAHRMQVAQNGANHRSLQNHNDDILSSECDLDDTFLQNERLEIQMNNQTQNFTPKLSIIEQTMTKFKELAPFKTKPNNLAKSASKGMMTCKNEQYYQHQTQLQAYQYNAHLESFNKNQIEDGAQRNQQSEPVSIQSQSIIDRGQLQALCAKINQNNLNIEKRLQIVESICQIENQVEISDQQQNIQNLQTGKTIQQNDPYSELKLQKHRVLHVQPEQNIGVTTQPFITNEEYFKTPVINKKVIDCQHKMPDTFRMKKKEKEDSIEVKSDISGFTYNNKDYMNTVDFDFRTPNQQPRVIQKNNQKKQQEMDKSNSNFNESWSYSEAPVIIVSNKQQDLAVNPPPNAQQLATKYQYEIYSYESQQLNHDSLRKLQEHRQSDFQHQEKSQVYLSQWSEPQAQIAGTPFQNQKPNKFEYFGSFQFQKGSIIQEQIPHLSQEKSDLQNYKFGKIISERPLQ